MFTRIFAILLVMLPIASHASTEPDGSISTPSKYSVIETADRLENLINEKGLSLFARVDHSANAESVNMTLRPSELIIFGNPKLGTPLMQCEQTVGLDLPQKMLIWEDEQGKVWLTYNTPRYIQKRHKVKGCDQEFAKTTEALAGLSKEALAD